MTREQLTEEPCAAKVASTVLETSGRSDPLTEFNRILKRAVLNRKNSLFYKTEHGAAVGDISMSLIQSCALAQVDVFDYLVTLLRNARAVRAAPSEWLPWNYTAKKALAA